MNGPSTRMALHQGDITKLQRRRHRKRCECDPCWAVAGSMVPFTVRQALDLLKECRALGGCPTGEARITGGYNLPAKHVIHTVGPIYSGARDDDPALAACYRTCIRLAVENDCKTLAFPAISTGVYHFPFDRAARIATAVTMMELERAPSIERVTFVLFSDADFQRFSNIFAGATSS